MERSVAFRDEDEAATAAAATVWDAGQRRDMSI
jgi:hypothetical protein